jgi:hypothetical protein
MSKYYDINRILSYKAQVSVIVGVRGYGKTASLWNSLMLDGTGGPFTGNPVINTTYYVENPPV